MTAVTTTRQGTTDPYDILTGVADGLFSLGNWHIVAIAEGVQGSDTIHFCNYTEETGRPIHWCYQHWGETVCPGCGEAQPEEIQALDQMMNYDTDYSGTHQITRMINKSIKQIFWHGAKKMFIEGDGRE